MCLHSAHSPHIPCYFPRFHIESAKYYLHFTGWAEEFKAAAQDCRAKPQPFPGSSVQNLCGCPRSEFNAQVQPLTQAPTSSSEFVFKVSTLQSPVIQMYSKFPEKQKGVTADLTCCHILSFMEEGVDLEA